MRVRPVMLAIPLMALGLSMSPVGAVSCVYRTDAEMFETADLVFVGTPTRSHDPNAEAPIRSNRDPIYWSFAVESVQKGAAETGISVTSHGPGPFRVAERAQVFAKRRGAGYWADECLGSRRLVDREPYLPVRTGETRAGSSPINERFPWELALPAALLLVVGALIGAQYPRRRA